MSNDVQMVSKNISKDHICFICVRRQKSKCTESLKISPHGEMIKSAYKAKDRFKEFNENQSKRVIFIGNRHPFVNFSFYYLIQTIKYCVEDNPAVSAYKNCKIVAYTSPTVLCEDLSKSNI